jgi:dolichol-phosphate mannosyltransferase
MSPALSIPSGLETAVEPAQVAALRLAVVVPTLNEEGNIGALIERARTALDLEKIPFEIIVVDDDSSDQTAARVEAIAAQDSRVRLIVRKGERGLSGAILDGWRASTADVYGVIDADLQHPPEVLPSLYKAIVSGRDLAIGSRYAQGGGTGNWNFVRKFLSSAAIWASWPLFRRGVRAHDPMAGLFMVRRECVENIPFQRQGFKLLLDVLVRSRVRSLAEVPIDFGLRTADESKANMGVGIDYARLLVRLYARKLGIGRG